MRKLEELNKRLEADRIKEQEKTEFYIILSAAFIWLFMGSWTGMPFITGFVIIAFLFPMLYSTDSEYQ